MDDSKNGAIELPVQTGKAIPHRGIDQELGVERGQGRADVSARMHTCSRSGVTGSRDCVFHIGSLASLPRLGFPAPSS